MLPLLFHSSKRFENFNEIVDHSGEAFNLSADCFCIAALEFNGAVNAEHLLHFCSLHDAERNVVSFTFHFKQAFHVMNLVGKAHHLGVEQGGCAHDLGGKNFKLSFLFFPGTSTTHRCTGREWLPAR